MAAPASGHRKTTITAAIARVLKRRSKTVRVFKTGPDCLDPQILEKASGQPTQQIALWMASHRVPIWPLAGSPHSDCVQRGWLGKGRGFVPDAATEFHG